MLMPFMPDSANKILDVLGVELNERSFNYIKNKTTQSIIKKIGNVTPIFPKIDE
jgi:methionyl-tRNA synthetase